MGARSHSKEEEERLMPVRMACLPHCPAGDREAQRGQVICPRSRRRRWPRPPHLREFPSRIPPPTPPFHALGPLQSAALRAGARASPRRPSVRPSVWVSTRAQPCTGPQPRALRSERQGVRSGRPSPHARSRQTAAPASAPLQPVRGSRRGKGAAAGRRRISYSLARSRSALRGSQAQKPQ